MELPSMQFSPPSHFFVSPDFLPGILFSNPRRLARAIRCNPQEFADVLIGISTSESARSSPWFFLK
jgi:hypothetical protein